MPRSFVRIALCGSAGLRSAIVPPEPGCFSALGAVMSDFVRERWRSGVAFDEIEAEIGRGTRYVEARYKGQSYELILPWEGFSPQKFHEAHRARYDIVATAARITVPWLLVHAEDDETVPIAEGKALAAAAPRAQSLLLERGGHTYGATHPLSGRPAAMERVFDATIAHFSGSLG